MPGTPAPTLPDPLDAPSAELAPESHNSEQDDGPQAQDVAEEARHRATHALQESEHGGRANPAQIMPDDTPDLIDKMNEMVTSGYIDNGAFAGEPMHDDEEDYLGTTEELEDDELAEDIADGSDEDYLPERGEGEAESEELE